MSTKLVVIFYIIMHTNISVYSRNILRILKGHDAKMDEHPFVVILETQNLRNYNRVCTGSLISGSWVLSAAHCLKIGDVSHVLYGKITDEFNDNTTYSKVIKKIPHPKFSYILALSSKDLFYCRNDIALLQVEKVPIETFGQLSAVDYSSLIGYPIKVLGFGLTSTNRSQIGTHHADPLQEADGIVVKCDEARSDQLYMCASYKCDNAQYAFLGDSGGPMIYNGKIAGVVSQVEPPWALGFIWPVSPYLSWIRDTIKLNN